MNRKMTKLFDTQLIEAHLKLDPDQIASKKMYNLFAKVLDLMYNLLMTGEILHEFPAC
jgi:hypothetical protein